MKHPKAFYGVYCGQQGDSTSATEMPMRGAHIDLPQDDILPPPAENVTDDIGEELHNAAEMRLPTPTSFQTTKTGFQKFESKLRSRIFRQQQYLEVI